MILRAPCFGLFLLAACLGGCTEPEVIRVQDEPKATKPKSPPIQPEQKKFRTLGAAFPADGDLSGAAARLWFVKISGPADVVAGYEADVRKLIGSVQTVPDERMIVWTTPPGWIEKRKSEPDEFGKLATIHSPKGDARVTISRAGGVLLANVIRWWGQLWGQDRANEITGATLLDYAPITEINGRLAFLIDLAGPNDPNPNQKRFRTLGAVYPAEGTTEKDPKWWFLKMSGPAEAVTKYEADARKIIESVRIPGAEGRPIDWLTPLPDGWKKDDRVSQFRHTTFVAPDGRTELTVTQASGSLASNVARWRDQLWGSDELDITDENLGKYATKTTIQGRTAYVVDLLGPNSPTGGPAMGGMAPPHGGMSPHGGK